MKVIPLLNPRVRSQSAKAYRAMVDSFYEKQKSDTLVKGVRIIFGAKATQVRLSEKRKEKREVTEKELALLCEEYERTTEELTALLKKRKIGIIK